ncbi:MAG: molybdopterin synthase catalytic subunit MoaE [Gammaproteobacteria bacterium]
MSECKTRISVQFADFSLKHEAEALRLDNGVGAIVTFSGLVRDMHGDQSVTGLFLEHYPGMTEKSLQAIAEEAQARWPLDALTIIHRIGELKAGEQIVFVGVSSAHRGAAFSACEFVMDYLKTRAPFWKKSLNSDGDCWVEAKDTDTTASERWRQAGA